MRYVIVYSLIMFLTACSGLEPFAEKNFKPIDTEPPVAVSIISIGQDCVQINTNESAFLKELVISSLEIDSIEEIDSGFIINTVEPMEMAAEYRVSGMLEDKVGNTSRFINSIYGLNPNPAELQISEFVPQGSTSHPDFTELLVTKAGNLAGLTIYDGMEQEFRSRIVLPDCEAALDDYILIHWKPQGIAVEINETASKSESGGIDAHAEAWDYWVPESSGLSGNNGAVCVYTTPGSGDMMDAAIYSNRTSASDTKYGGFGSASMRDLANAVHDSGLWEFSGEVPLPEECINPDDSTATRSICRRPAESSEQVLNGKHSWYITATSGATRGYANSTEEYAP